MAASLDWKVKREKLFDRTLPEARWNCSRYQPDPPKPKKWRVKRARL
jgi:hypothetical protein